MLRWVLFAVLGYLIWTKIRPAEPPKRLAKKKTAAVELVDGRSPFEILGVAEGASSEEIQRAYHRLIKEHHPDRATEGAKDAAEARTRLLNRAYEALKRRT